MTLVFSCSPSCSCTVSLSLYLNSITSCIGCSNKLFHSFSNVPSRKEVYTPGTTHVAIGYVVLAWSSYTPSLPSHLPACTKTMHNLVLLSCITSGV
jgi:hypothetical protein